MIILLNKTDLQQIIGREDAFNLLRLEGWAEEMPPVLEISARMQEGIDILEQTITGLFDQGNISFNDQVIITSMRQKEKLEEAREFLSHVSESILLGLPEDFYTIDLTGAYDALGQITGESAGEDLINEIFDRFCMGK